jgi:elongation factor Ts
MSAALIKELRERTGLGLLECKKALAAASGDVEKAIEEMRKSSGMKAAKKAGRTAADGVVVARVADDGSYGVIVEVNSETDFVARDENFLGFVNSVVDAAFAGKQTDVAALMAGDLESSREALVQKIGENISVRRIELVNADSGVVGFYVHGTSPCTWLRSTRRWWHQRICRRKLSPRKRKSILPRRRSRVSRRKSSRR